MQTIPLNNAEKALILTGAKHNAEEGRKLLLNGKTEAFGESIDRLLWLARLLNGNPHRLTLLEAE